jgi:hypothetical protein
MDTATVSVIASSTVAVAAIGATWLQHRASLKHERTVVDLDNVRDVLDSHPVRRILAYAIRRLIIVGSLPRQPGNTPLNVLVDRSGGLA